MYLHTNPIIPYKRRRRGVVDGAPRSKNSPSGKSANFEQVPRGIPHQESERASPPEAASASCPRIRIDSRLIAPHITCTLCNGYLLNATSVDPCLHTFCKSCIYKHCKKDQSPSGEKMCPTCQTVLGANPAAHLKVDHAMQNLAYILAPGLADAEREARVGVTDTTAAAAEPALERHHIPSTLPPSGNPTHTSPDRLIAFALDLDPSCMPHPVPGLQLPSPFLKTKSTATIHQVAKHIRKRLATRPDKVEIIFKDTVLQPEWTLGFVATTMCAGELGLPLRLLYRPDYGVRAK
ncbi:hypothetical protein DFJ77DRAFT_153717 [Powellomyces hirtus]|nr:hypothetical protein DFJ77DRAFT_153717 [Powellomyces hirtus]